MAFFFWLSVSFLHENKFMTVYQHKLLSKCCFTNSAWILYPFGKIFQPTTRISVLDTRLSYSTLFEGIPSFSASYGIHYLLLKPMGLINWVNPVVRLQNWTQLKYTLNTSNLKLRKTIMRLCTLQGTRILSLTVVFSQQQVSESNACLKHNSQYSRRLLQWKPFQNLP